MSNSYIHNRVLSKAAFCSSSRKIEDETRSDLEGREHHRQEFDDEIGQKAQFREKSNEQGVSIIHTKDLPLCCPKSDQVTWDSHPRVYLPIKKTGTIVCPYCDTVYYLAEEDIK